MSEVYCVILAGGFGKRLAPISTDDKPKQFHDLNNVGASLFQQTVIRALKITSPANIIPVANIAHKSIVLSQLAAANNTVAQNVIFESQPRNTAYAIALATKKIGNGVIVVMPSDHAIEGSFAEDISDAVELAKSGRIVTLGIKPHSPDTNYGYLYENSFFEKPEEYVAEELIERDAMWNSGIFVFQAETVLAELAMHYGDDIESIPAISFDKAVMEHTDKMAVIRANFAWADLGTHESLKRFSVKEEIAV